MFVSEECPCPVGPRQAGQFSARAEGTARTRIVNAAAVFMRLSRRGSGEREVSARMIPHGGKLFVGWAQAASPAGPPCGRGKETRRGEGTSRLVALMMLRCSDV